MFIKNFLIGLFVAFLSVGLVGTVFASDSPDPAFVVGTEAGELAYDFDNQNTIGTEAARNHEYNEETLAAIGTEAGDWKHDFDAQDTKATETARNHTYNADELAAIGTEAGYTEHDFAGSNSTQESNVVIAQNSSLAPADRSLDPAYVVGTEAGDWEYDFDAPETKATMAAKSHVYDEEKLASVGTEAGDLSHDSNTSNSQSSSAVAGEGRGADAVCSEC